MYRGMKTTICENLCGGAHAASPRWICSNDFELHAVVMEVLSLHETVQWPATKVWLNIICKYVEVVSRRQGIRKWNHMDAPEFYVVVIVGKQHR